MDIAELMTYVAAALDRVGVAYMVTGSMASVMYGEIRTTADVDMVVDLKPGQVKPLQQQFPEEEFYFSEEAAHQAIRENGMFNVIHPRSGFKADLIVAGTNPINLARLRRATELDVAEGVKVRFSTPEDVILAKLQFYAQGGSDKHLRDISGILMNPYISVNLDFIGGLAERWGLGETWQKLLAVAKNGRPEARGPNGHS